MKIYRAFSDLDSLLNPKVLSLKQQVVWELRIQDLVVIPLEFKKNSPKYPIGVIWRNCKLYSYKPANMFVSIYASIYKTIYPTNYLHISLYYIYIYVGALTVFLSIHLYHYDHFPLVSNTAISLRTSNSQCCPSIPSGANGFAGWYHMFAMDMGLYGSDHSSK